jgi:hypothetical protein
MPRTKNKNTPGALYHAARAILGEKRWSLICRACPGATQPEQLLQALAELKDPGIPRYLPDLIRLEAAVSSALREKDRVAAGGDRVSMNPSIRLIELSWKNLTQLLPSYPENSATPPEPSIERVLVWYDAGSGMAKARPATDEDLLVLKMMLEDIAPEAVAAEGNLPKASVYAAIDRAVRSGLLISPPSRITRDPSVFSSKRK